jgi:hypothetical protein
MHDSKYIIPDNPISDTIAIFVKIVKENALASYVLFR